MHSQKSSQQPQDYRKLFPELPALNLSDDELWQLSCLMTETSNCMDSSSITNGEATFGQLLAHDMTFENVSQFKKTYYPKPLTNIRTISLDLDSLYGLRTEAFITRKIKVANCCYAKKGTRKGIVGMTCPGIKNVQQSYPIRGMTKVYWCREFMCYSCNFTTNILTAF